MSALTLKDQLLALCDEHGLTSLNIAVCTSTNRAVPLFVAYAHAGPMVEQGLGDDPAACIALAITNLNSKRYISPVIAELVAA